MSLPPGALKVELVPLATLVLLPAAAGLLVAACLSWLTPEAAQAAGWTAFAMGVVKLCYLGTAAAHVGHWVADRGDGAAALLGLAEEREGPAAPDPAFWHAFPNAVDGALLALALTTAAHRLA
ncbi:MAG TPA: hypothetical protein VEB20_12885 [Azospirillaceae bacterium]|nr:hypothetical protein [Azospirillaceae bacterium]